jgi:hypothetical protein
MSDLPHEFWEALRKALAAEFRTDVGHINFVFGLLAFGLVLVYIAGSKLEEIANLILLVFGKRGRPKEPKDHFWAIISVLALFTISLFIAYLAREHP